MYYKIVLSCDVVMLTQYYQKVLYDKLCSICIRQQDKNKISLCAVNKEVNIPAINFYSVQQCQLTLRCD